MSTSTETSMPECKKSTLAKIKLETLKTITGLDGLKKDICVTIMDDQTLQGLVLDWIAQNGSVQVTQSSNDPKKFTKSIMKTIKVGVLREITSLDGTKKEIEDEVMTSEDLQLLVTNWIKSNSNSPSKQQATPVITPKKFTKSTMKPFKIDVLRDITDCTGSRKDIENEIMASEELQNKVLDALNAPKEEAPADPDEEAQAPPKEEAPTDPEEEAPADPKEEAPADPEEEAQAPPKEEAQAPPEEEAPADPEEEAPAPPKEEAQAPPKKEAKDSDDEESDSDGEIEVTFDNSPPIVEDTPTGDVFQHEEETYHFDKPNLIVYKKSEVFGYAIKVASRKKLVLPGYMVVETIIEGETDCECILSNVEFTLTDGKWVVPKKTKK